MAAKPLYSTEAALEKIQECITCVICLEQFERPKQLSCNHVFCEQCLESMVSGGKRSILCPTCRHMTCVPRGGIPQLQTAFYYSQLREIQDTFERSDRCPKHPGKEAEFYCETCQHLMCSYCLGTAHKQHQYDLVSNAFAVHKEVILETLNPLENQISTLESAVESVEERRAVVDEQDTAVTTEIHSIFTQLRKALQTRETELLKEAKQISKLKFDELRAQQDEFELQLHPMKRCRDFVWESLNSCTPGKVLGMKDDLVDRITNHIITSLKPESLSPAKEADMKLAYYGLPELVKNFEQFGEVYTSVVCPQRCHAFGKGIKIATRGRRVSLSVEALDEEGEACLKKVDSLNCRVVARDSSSQVRGNVTRGDGNVYHISYEPETTGEHQLHILINDCPILNSPFAVTVLPDFTTPANIIGDLKGPCAVAIEEGGNIMVVAEEDGGSCVSIISKNGEKKILVRSASASTQFAGIANIEGNVLITDHGNHCIQQCSSTGRLLRTVGREGSGPLRFRNPTGISIHPLTHKAYIVDSANHRIQILNSDLTLFACFGEEGCGNGEFESPYDTAIDREGNVYVADCNNHRIQVFTTNGDYLRQFGRRGEGEGELNQPVSISINQQQNVVYVGEQGNNRVSIFSTRGDYVTSFGGERSGPVQFNGLNGLVVDNKGTVYVSDQGNNRILLFT